MALDANGVPLILHIPAWQKEKSLVFDYMWHSLTIYSSFTTGDFQPHVL
jgi:hypothetical protein